MKLKLYEWFIGKQSAFVNSFVDNEQLKAQAKAFWKQLESGTWFYIIAFIVIAAFFAYLYYKPYNNRPGRHFRPSHWAIFGVISIVVTFLATLLIAVLMAYPKLDGSFVIEFKIALANILYAAVIYILCSLGFCLSGKTNAYIPFKLRIKLKKK